jgi:hypothetical protein
MYPAAASSSLHRLRGLCIDAFYVDHAPVVSIDNACAVQAIPKIQAEAGLVVPLDEALGRPASH